VSFTPSDSVAGHRPASFERAGRQGWLRWLWSRREGRLEDIRRLMLAQLGSVPDADRRAGLAVSIKSAGDSESLWALRGEWMQALAETQGVLLARQRLSDVSFMFAGMLDREQHARNGLEVLQSDAPRGLVRSAAQMRADH
jgi:hypothetical protein